MGFGLQSQKKKMTLENIMFPLPKRVQYMEQTRNLPQFMMGLHPNKPIIN